VNLSFSATVHLIGTSSLQSNLWTSVTFREAEQRFFLLPLEKEVYCDSENTIVFIVLGGKPPNPQVSLRSKLWTSMTFREAELRFLLLFLEKEEYCHSENTVNHIFLGGKPPNPQCSLRSKLWACMIFREAEQLFLLLFLEKEEYCHSGNTVEHILFGGQPPNPQTPRARFARGYGHAWPSAKRNNAFCFFFWKKKYTATQRTRLSIYYLRANPQDPLLSIFLDVCDLSQVLILFLKL
jgi:hypothetical protein